MNKLFTITILIFQCAFGFSQTFGLVKGNSETRNNRLYFGVKNMETNQLVVPTEYSYIYFIADSQFVQVDYQGKKGVFNLEGDVIIPTDYDEIISFDGQVYKVKLNNKWGIVNAKNEIQSPLEYDWIVDESEKLKRVKKGAYFGIIDENNEIVLPLGFSAMPIKWRLYYITIEKGAYGLFNRLGQQVLESQYSKISPLFNRYLLLEKDGKYCIWIPNEPTQINFEYSFISRPYNELVSATNVKGSGVIDSTLKIIVPFKYDEPIEVRSMILRVDSGSYFGYYNRAGERLTDIYYFENRYFASGWLILESHKQKTLVNISGEKHERFVYQDLYVIDNERAAVKEDEFLWSIRDIRTNERISDKAYRYISRFKRGVGFAKNQDGYCLLVNDKLEEMTPAKYSYILLQEDYAEVTIKRKKGIVNYKGKEVVPVKYERISANDAYYNANTRYREDVYNKAGKKLFKKSYKHVVNWSEGRFQIYKNRRWGILDSNSHEIVPFKYRQILVVDGLYVVKSDKKTWQILDEELNIKCQLEADFLNPIGEGLIRVNRDYKNGLIDITGDEIIPIKFDRIDINSKGGIIVTKQGKKGIYSKKGALIIPVEYDLIENYYGNYAGVRKDGKWGHINAQGALLYEPKYDAIANFLNQKATVTLNNKQTLIDEKGGELIPFQYEVMYYTRTRERLIDIRLNNKCGLLDLNMNEVVPPQYASIGVFDRNNLALVFLQNNGPKKYGVINSEGIEIVPPIYDKITFDNLRIIAIENGIKRHFTLQGECLNCIN